MYAVVILIGGGDHDFDVGGDAGLDMGADFGADALDGSVEISSLSPIAIAGFVTAFGAFGLIAQGLFSASPAMSLVWATVGGIVVGLASNAAFFYFFIKPQGSSETRRVDIIGATGDVITPIPSDSVGGIALVARGSRVTMTARSASGSAIPRGTLVKVTDMVGSVVLVEPVQKGKDTAEEATADDASPPSETS
jgi:membrane-bound ClpP family serine protease